MVTWMGLIRENTLALFTARTGYEELVDFLTMIQGMVDGYVPVSIEPGYIVAKSPANPARVYTVALPPHTFFIHRGDVTSSLRWDLVDRCYILVRPSWIKTVPVDIVFVKEIIEKMHGGEEGLIEFDNAVIKLVYDGQLQPPPIIVDNMFRYNASWTTGRKPFLDYTYIRIIRETVGSKPSRDILAHNGTKPIIYVEHGKNPQLVIHFNEAFIDKYARIYLDMIIDFIAMIQS